MGNRLFSEGLHHLGAPPTPAALRKYLSAYLDGRLPDDAVERIAAAPRSHLDDLRQALERQFAAPAASTSGGGGGGGEDLRGVVGEAIEVRQLLEENTQELASLVRALNGEYVLPEAGGDLLRDGPGVLPTGAFLHKYRLHHRDATS